MDSERLRRRREGLENDHTYLQTPETEDGSVGSAQQLTGISVNQKESQVVVLIYREGKTVQVLTRDSVPYMCTLCGFTFMHAALLKQHSVNVHGYKEPAVNSGGKGNEVSTAPSEVDHQKSLASYHAKSKPSPSSAACRQENPNRHSAELHARHPVNGFPHDSDNVLKKNLEKFVKIAPKRNIEPGCKDTRQVLKARITTKETVLGQSILDLKKSGDVRTIEDKEEGIIDNISVDGTKVSTSRNVSEGICSLQSQNDNRMEDDEVEPILQNRGKENDVADGLLSEEAPCIASVVPSSDEEVPTIEEEEKDENEQVKGKKKRVRRKYRPKCCICGLKCDSVRLRYHHAADEHRLYQNIEEASFYMRVPVLKLLADSKVDGTKRILLKCPHCRACCQDMSVLRHHIGGHCGTVSGVKCHLCSGAIELWENEKFDELEALLNKLQEIDDNDQGSGWDRIQFGTDGSWNWKEQQGDSTSVMENSGSFSCSMKQPTASCKKTLPQQKRVKFCPPLVSSCYECGEKFFFKAHAMNHYQYAHQSITCKDCGTVVRTFKELSAHSEQMHKGRGIFRCDQCPQAFHNGGKLHYHQEGHLGLFKCEPCGKTFMTLENMDRHVTKHCCGLSRPSNTQEQEPFTQDLLTCPICRIEFVRKAPFYRHLSKFHPTQTVIDPVPLQDIADRCVCDQCGKSFSNSTVLSAHIKRTHRAVEKYVTCTFPGCLKTFLGEDRLKNHATVHKVCSRYRCEVCGKVLKTCSSLRSHKSRHLGILPYSCRFCGKRFTDNQKLIAHESSIHTGKTKHVCPDCGKGFATSSRLKLHLASHSTTRPFECDTCHASFSGKFSLRSHQRTHTKPFRCKHCGEGFAQKGGRRRHLLKVHNIVEPVERFRVEVIQNGNSSV